MLRFISDQSIVTIRDKYKNVSDKRIPVELNKQKTMKNANVLSKAYLALGT